MTTQTTRPSEPVDLDLPIIRRGKVRQVYDLPAERAGAGGGGGRVLMVATDRISAFDVVLPTPIPGKGVILTQIAAWWFNWISRRGLVETHLLSTSVDDIPAGAIPADRPDARDWLEGRITIGRKCRVIPIECVVRGYLEGSGWKDYQRTGSVCGHKLPAGLKQCDKLPEPLFTPATKADTGHDENITFEQAADIIGLETISVLRDLSLKIYTEAAAYALQRGLIIADTKFEFGIPLDEHGQAMGGGVVPGRVWNQPILIDEALTPDSSRFWPADSYEPGKSQPSFDKQFVREYLTGLVESGKWDKTEPGPALPEDVVAGTIARYEEAFERLCR